MILVCGFLAHSPAWDPGTHQALRQHLGHQHLPRVLDAISSTSNVCLLQEHQHPPGCLWVSPPRTDLAQYCLALDSGERNRRVRAGPGTPGQAWPSTKNSPLENGATHSSHIGASLLRTGVTGSAGTGSSWLAGPVCHRTREVSNGGRQRQGQSYAVPSHPPTGPVQNQSLAALAGPLAVKLPAAPG